MSTGESGISVVDCDFLEETDSDTYLYYTEKLDYENLESSSFECKITLNGHTCQPDENGQPCRFLQVNLSHSSWYSINITSSHSKF